MRSMVVYKSFYGNTESIAPAAAKGLARHGEAQAIKVGAVEDSMLSDVDLLVIGTPTQAWGLSRTETRASVADASQPLVRQWLESLPAGHNRPAAAFATRLHSPRLLTGSGPRDRPPPRASRLETDHAAPVVPWHRTLRSTGIRRARKGRRPGAMSSVPA
jgi:hypothetical protein